MRVRVVVGVALALVLAAVVIVLSRSDERLAGTNGIKQQAFVLELRGGQRACQQSGLLDDTAAVELLVGTYGRPLPALTVTFADDSGDVVRGQRGAGGREGAVTIPLDRVVEGTRGGTRACVTNRGRRPIALGGDISNADTAARVGANVSGGVVAFRYMREGRESWWALVPTIASRFGVGKAPVFGTWTLAFAALLLLAVWVATIRLLLRMSR